MVVNPFNKSKKKEKENPLIEALKNPVSPVKTPINNPIEEPPKKDEFFYDEKGFPTGITRGDKTYFGLNQEEAENIAAQEQRKQALQQGIIAPVGTQQAQIAEQQRLAQVAERIGATGQAGVMGGTMGQPEMMGDPTALNWRQVFLSTISDPSTIRDIGGGAAAGAVGGAAIAGVGSIPGAIGGAALGVYTSVMRNIKSQKSDNLAAQKYVLTDGERNLNQLISLMNMDPSNSHLYVAAMNEQLDNIAKANEQLYIDTQSNLNLALSIDGTKQRQKFENFYAAGGGYDVLTTKAQVAIASPNMEEGMRGLIMAQQSIGGEE